MTERYQNRKIWQKTEFQNIKRKYILIVCEGEKTEPNYFRRFRVPNHTAYIETIGLGSNTVSLVEEALTIAKKYRPGLKINFDEIWVVFDKDSFLPQDFNKAISLCKKSIINGKTVEIHAAWSNEAFELWYCLHYDFINHKCERKEFSNRLNKKFIYHKNIEDARLLIKNSDGDESQAIIRAKKLHQQWEGQTDYHNHNPCTTVYKLVEKLRGMEIK
jgi:hypothetical protein